MSEAFASPIRWNIFARELSDLLEAREKRLGHLDDRWDEQGRLVHPEKVRRLQHSLQSPKCLAVLTPEELERVAVAFNLTDKEMRRLRAALLATAVEAMLLDRIPPQHALRGADEVFHVVLTALDASTDGDGLSRVRGGAMTAAHVAPAPGDAPTTCDDEFLGALDLIDRSSLWLHLSLREASGGERLAQAQGAVESAERAVALLDRSRRPDHGEVEWRYWRDAAQRACLAAAERVGFLRASEDDVMASVERANVEGETTPAIYALVAADVSGTVSGLPISLAARE